MTHPETDTLLANLRRAFEEKTAVRDPVEEFFSSQLWANLSEHEKLRFTNRITARTYDA